MSNYASGDFKSRYGTVHMSNPGPKKEPPYSNVKTYHQDSGGTVILQAPAMKAFKAAELRITPKRLKRKGKVRNIRITGVGYRSYSTQRALYEGPDNTGGTRFADPDGSNHVEALAVDLDTRWWLFGAEKRALEAEGFNFTVGGESWHGAFRVTG